MATLCEQVGNWLAADFATLKRLRLATCQGRVREAMRLLKSMEPRLGPVNAIAFTENALIAWESRRNWPRATPADRTLMLSTLYQEMGRLLAALGQYGDALGAFTAGLNHASGVARPVLRLSAASALLEGGDLDAAAFELDSLQADLGPDVPADAAVAWSELRGKLFLLRGEFGTALGQFRGVVNTCRSLGFHHARRRAMLNLAHVLILLNQTAAAEKTLVNAVEETGEDDESFSSRADDLLRLARERGLSLAEGVAIASSVTELWAPSPAAAPGPADRDQPQSPDRPQPASYLSFFEDRALGFQMRLARGDLSSALERLNDLHAVFGPTDSRLIQTRLRVLSSLFAYYAGQYEEASLALVEAIALLESMGMKPELWQAQRVLGWCWARLGRNPDDVEALVARTDALLAEIGQTLDVQDRTIFQLNKWTWDEEYLASRINALVLAKASLPGRPWFLSPLRRLRIVSELNRLLHEIDRHKAALNRRIVDGGGNLGTPEPATVSAPPPLWRRLLAQPRRRLTVTYLVLPDRVFLACQGWLSLDFGVSAVTRLQVRELVGAGTTPSGASVLPRAISSSMTTAIWGRPRTRSRTASPIPCFSRSAWPRLSSSRRSWRRFLRGLASSSSSPTTACTVSHSPRSATMGDFSRNGTPSRSPSRTSRGDGRRLRNR